MQINRRNDMNHIIYFIVLLIGVTKCLGCASNMFECGNKNCIPQSWVCDNENDCSDGSDENQPECLDPKSLHTECGESHFKCSGPSGKCIPKKWLCDAETDCGEGDNSDEDPAMCATRTCGQDQFACSSKPGMCIGRDWVCDDQSDCPGAEDEDHCEAKSCLGEEFTCDSGQCITRNWVCDGADDCDDGSDEKNCPPEKPCGDTEFTCTNGACINIDWHCDGDMDCADSSDETNCPTIPVGNGTVCRPWTFACADGINCIHAKWACDGDADCPDGSDEANCPEVTCRPDQFKCSTNQQCIPRHLVCNDVPECRDESDEENCTPTPVCEVDQFHCGNGTCISMEKVCDGISDCNNTTDEPKDRCNVNECEVNNGNCSQLCVDTKIGHHCECQPGYSLVDNSACVDINECEIPGICSQTCINEEGSFQCECVEGYIRVPHDHTRCKAQSGSPSLLFTHRHDIRKIDLDERHDMMVVINNTRSSAALDYNFRTGMVFWSDVNDERIYSAPLDDGKNRKTLINHQKIVADGIAVDWIYHHLYWTDAERDTIEVANLDGSMRKTLFRDNIDSARAIAVNPLEGWIFWTDWGVYPRIERAGADGLNRTVIIDTHLEWANGLTLDLVARRLYWIDFKQRSISSCNFDGSDRRRILHSTSLIKQPFSITLFEDYLYWTDWSLAQIIRANKFTGENATVITGALTLEFPNVVHVYHEYRQPAGINHCQPISACSHLCLPAPVISGQTPHVTCACPDDMFLTDDMHNCMDKKDFPNYISTVSPDQVTRVNSTSHVRTSITMDSEEDNGAVAGLVIGVVSTICVLLAVIGLFVYRRYFASGARSMNFDNPVYRKTTEDQFALQKNHNYNKNYPAPVREDTLEPLNSPGTNEYV